MHYNAALQDLKETEDLIRQIRERLKEEYARLEKTLENVKTTLNISEEQRILTRDTLEAVRESQRNKVTYACDCGSLSIRVRDGERYECLHCYKPLTEETDVLREYTLRMRAEKEVRRLTIACSRQQDEIQQILGKALHYPAYADDQTTFPGATGDDVCVGDHVAETLAAEIAERYEDEKTRRQDMKKALERIADFTTNPYAYAFELRNVAREALLKDGERHN